MKIQIALVDPDLVSQPGLTVFAGLIEHETLFNDFDVMPISLSLREDGKITTVLGRSQIDNLARRNDFPEEILKGTFTYALKQKVWQRYASDDPAGEMAMVRTEMPGLPEGRHAYVVFGLIGGEREALKALSGRVLETNRPLESGVVATMGHMVDSGREVSHTLGSSLLSILRKPVWGFGPEKFGNRSDVSIDEFKGIAVNTMYIIENGENISNEFGRKPSKTYIEFLREMDKRGLVPGPMWETSEQMSVREAAAGEIAQASVTKERLDELVTLKQALADPAP